MKMKVLFASCIFVVVLLCGVLVVDTNAKSYNSKAIPSLSVNDDFDDDCVLVMLDQSISEVNKKHNKSFFGNIEIEGIEDLTYNENWNPNSSEKCNGFRQVLKIKLKSHSKEQVLSAVNVLQEIDGIICACPNYYGKKGTTIEDPYYVYQWALNGANGINVAPAWDFSVGVQDVKVGILDTGIAAHDDLNANLISGINYVGIDTNDIDGHGTRVAGVVGAVGNSFGISGVCRKISLVPIKFDGSIADVQRALTYAGNNDIKIVNMSFWNFPDCQLLHDAIESFNGLFVCIAGNDGENIANTPNYPASYHLCNMLVVGAINSDGNKYTNSNYGINVVDIYAPGDGVLTTNLNNSFTVGAGTSISAPHATGVAALLLSIEPNLTASQLKTAILEGADDIVIQVPTGPGGSLENQYVKKLNAYGAVKYVLANYSSTPYTLNGNTIDTSHTVLANNDYFINDNVFYKLNVTYSNEYDFNISASYPIDVILYDSSYNQLSYIDLNNSNNVDHFIKYLSTGTYYLRVKFSDDSQSGTINTQISIYNHTHSYSYEWLNLTEHNVECECGYSYTEVHAITQGPTPPGQPYKTCIICGGYASMGIVPFSSNNLPRTINGSYILPNGVIVLADADIDAYLNGTLSFIHLNNKKMVNNCIPFAVKKEEDNLPFGK